VTVDAAIVGGGIAGLAAAYELSRLGRSFMLLEAAPRAGGVILSEQIDGFTIDGGPDALLIQKPEAIRLCEELGLGDRLVATKPPRLAYIQRGGRLHPLPAASVLGIPTRIGPFVRTSLFSWPGKLRMGAEIFVPPRRDDGDESIGAFMTRRFGREATEYLAEPLLAGIHAGDVDRLSLRSLFPRFGETERKHGSLLRAFRRARPGPASEGAFKSLPGGLSELVCALTAAIGPRQMRLNARVTAIDIGGPFTVRTSSELITSRALVIAAPAFAAADLLRDNDPDLAGLCAEIRYSSVATVALAFDRGDIDHPLNGSGFVVPRKEGTGILAASWLSSKWPHRAPEGRALLRTFIGGAREPQMFERDDRELVALSMSALGPLLGIRRNPMFTRIYRWPRANAQHEVGHHARLGAIEGALGRHPGLFLTGSGFRGVGIPDCVADARATARRVDEFLNSQFLIQNS
jgi:protoporphyrinogen/coproporphyrinogen III oxidase